MYTRSYTEEKNGILIPESYGGTAFSEKPRHEEQPANEHGKNPWEENAEYSDEEEAKEESVETSSPLSKIKAPAFLSNILNFNNFSLQKIGKEEILILAAAAFLFFSKEGDRELAIMLLLLLFLG